MPVSAGDGPAQPAADVLQDQVPHADQGRRFGTNYSLDISAIDATTGARIPIDNGKLGGTWWWDTDNLYMPSVAGSTLVLDHTYHRGIYIIDLTNTNSRWVKTYNRRATGEYTTQADVTWIDDITTHPMIATAQEPFGGRSAAIVVGGRFFANERFAVSCIEPSN